MQYFVFIGNRDIIPFTFKATIIKHTLQASMRGLQPMAIARSARRILPHWT